MDHAILQLITAMTGSMGFALLFHVRPRLVLPAALGGFFNWWVYLISARFFDGVLTPSVITAAFYSNYNSSYPRKHALLYYEQYCRQRLECCQRVRVYYCAVCAWYRCRCKSDLDTE